MSMESEFGVIRGHIDDIDDQINTLLARRALWALQMKRAKAGSSTPVYQPGREAEILDRVTRTHDGPLGAEAVGTIFGTIIESCRELQNEQPDQQPVPDTRAV